MLKFLCIVLSDNNKNYQKNRITLKFLFTMEKRLQLFFDLVDCFH